MVLAELGGSITRALQQMSNATIIDEKVLNDCLKEITRALLHSDVQFNLVKNMQTNIKKIVNIEDLAAGHNKRKIIQQLADAKDVVEAVRNMEDAKLPVLTPNLKGFEAAVKAGAKAVAVFASASESFSKSNINCSIEESLTRYRVVCHAASKLSIPVRGYVSCVIGCPVEGAIPSSKVAYVAKQLHDMGCSEISLGDTIGVGTPGISGLKLLQSSLLHHLWNYLREVF